MVTGGKYSPTDGGLVPLGLADALGQSLAAGDGQTVAGHALGAGNDGGYGGRACTHVTSTRQQYVSPIHVNNTRQQYVSPYVTPARHHHQSLRTSRFQHMQPTHIINTRHQHITNLPNTRSKFALSTQASLTCHKNTPLAHVFLTYHQHTNPSHVTSTRVTQTSLTHVSFTRHKYMYPSHITNTCILQKSPTCLFFTRHQYTYTSHVTNNPYTSPAHVSHTSPVKHVSLTRYQLTRIPHTSPKHVSFTRHEHTYS